MDTNGNWSNIKQQPLVNAIPYLKPGDDDKVRSLSFFVGTVQTYGKSFFLISAFENAERKYAPENYFIMKNECCIIL